MPTDRDRASDEAAPAPDRAVDPVPLTLDVGTAGTVSALWCEPAGATACFVFAHGAGAGMSHAFMTAFASGFATRGIATLRFQFPFMERGSRRTDAPAIAHATVRAAVGMAARRGGGVPLFAGGKSFGGRMTSQAQALDPLTGVRGLVFVGFPLHPAGKPSVERAAHLQSVRCPMLFLQGTRDELADAALIDGVARGLGPTATLRLFDDADHAFHVRAKSGGNDVALRDAMLDTAAAWMRSAAPG